MRAVRWHARGDVRLDEVPVPTPRGSEVLIRVEAAGICGTDIHEVRAGPITVPAKPHPVNGRTAPVTLGHEMVGFVVETAAASGPAPGTRVAPWPSQPCGTCRDCITGCANRCPLVIGLGMSADGGMADYLVADAAQCVPIAPDVALERAVLVEPFAVALHGLHQVAVAGRRVAVIGIGSIGLCVIEAAVHAGAREIIAISRSESRRCLALEAGATDALAPAQAADADAEVAFEAAGAAPAMTASLTAVRRGGRVVVLGGQPEPSEIDWLDLTVREVIVQGSVSHCLSDFVRAADAISAGDIARVGRAVTMAPLEEGPMLLRVDDASTKRILVPGLP